MVYCCCMLVDAPEGAYVVGKDAHKFADKHLQCFNSDTTAFLLNVLSMVVKAMAMIQSPK